MSKVVVIGGGAAGMIAAYAAANGGHQVTLLEKNEKLGKKIYITGKGRCNFTNASDMETIRNNVVTNPRFLYSAFSAFDNNDIVELLNSAGCPSKVERGNRVFPVSDHASDVNKALTNLLVRTKVEVCLNTEVKDLIVEGNICKGVLLKNGKKIMADDVIVATGGVSYPSTGSTGDGYRFARNCGHDVTEVRPALVAMKTREKWVKQLSGLSLKNVAIKVNNSKKTLYSDFGDMLFTYDGVSGPVIISASSVCGKYLPLELCVDLKPALNNEVLDKRILKDFSENQNKTINNVIGKLLPIKLGLIILGIAGIDENTIIHDVTAAQRRSLLETVKCLKLNLVELKPFTEAIVTQGGVVTKQIDPKTMESKLVNNLYFAGEVMDVDGMTGGYNLQIAWSTGYLAGKGVR